MIRSLGIAIFMFTYAAGLFLLLGYAERSWGQPGKWAAAAVYFGVTGIITLGLKALTKRLEKQASGDL